MNVKLTKRKAWELISRIQPRLNIKQEATPSDVAIFKASTGPEGLEIRCENDWFNHNGRIKLTIGNVDGGTPIIRYYYPDTLNRDYVAEQAEKEAEAKQARKEWVWANPCLSDFEPEPGRGLYYFQGKCSQITRRNGKIG